MANATTHTVDVKKSSPFAGLEGHVVLDATAITALGAVSSGTVRDVQDILAANCKRANAVATNTIGLAQSIEA